MEDQTKNYRQMTDSVEITTGTHHNYDETGVVFISVHWNSLHVMKAAKHMQVEITRDQANEIMRTAIKNYNPTDEGFSWEYIQLHIDNYLNPQVSPEEMASAQSEE